MKMYCIWMTTPEGTTHLIYKSSDKALADFSLSMARQTFPNGKVVMTEGAE